MSREETAKTPCTYFQQGKCRRDDKCFYKRENAAAPTKDPKRTNRPAPKKKASAKAAPCITQRYACIAKGKGLPKATKAMKDQCHRLLCSHQKWNTSRSPQLVNNEKLCISLDCMTTTIPQRSQCQSLTGWLLIVLRCCTPAARDYQALQL